MHEISLLLGTWATSDLDLRETKTLQSPMGPFKGLTINDRIGLFPILRAGLGMVDAFLTLLPTSRVHHLGLYREKTTLLPVEYYNKLPASCEVDMGIVLDPMVATAGTAIATVNILKDWGLKRIKFVCVLASREGLKAIQDAHPDISIYCAAVDDELNDEGYVIPGLGDAGDRQFNTFHD
ncbi:hypothetical protein MP638_007516 [Amoeboaphelidium occidentale]|nr:hypothetical protein MP638_007516 [Amoeboaphelidium occidentale]